MRAIESRCVLKQRKHTFVKIAKMHFNKRSSLLVIDTRLWKYFLFCNGAFLASPLLPLLSVAQKRVPERQILPSRTTRLFPPEPFYILLILLFSNNIVTRVLFLLLPSAYLPPLQTVEDPNPSPMQHLHILQIDLVFALFLLLLPSLFLLLLLFNLRTTCARLFLAGHASHVLFLVLFSTGILKGKIIGGLFEL